MEKSWRKEVYRIAMILEKKEFTDAMKFSQLFP
jgi:hypothetical protein